MEEALQGELVVPIKETTRIDLLGNQYGIGNVGNNGAFRKFKSPEMLSERVAEYFEKTPKTDWTMSGLALFLDVHRDTVWEYGQKDGFSDIIKKAKLMMENVYEIDLRNKNNPSGSIFALKNFKWSDKQEVEHSLAPQIHLDMTDSPQIENPDTAENSP